MAPGGQASIRVVVAGEKSTGKSGLIVSATATTAPFLKDKEVPHVVPPTNLTLTAAPKSWLSPAIIPFRITNSNPDAVPLTIIDTDSTFNWKLNRELLLADVILFTSAFNNPTTLTDLRTFWFPKLVQLQVTVPVIVVRCMSDLQDNEDGSMSKAEVIARFKDHRINIYTCIECSALRQSEVHEVFYAALHAVLYPTEPLFDLETKSFKPRCLGAIPHIFDLSDHDGDGALSDAELSDFQVRCFDAPMQPTDVMRVKMFVQERRPYGVNEHGLTLSGFHYLLKLSMEIGCPAATWIVLRKFGYNNDIELRDDLLPSAFKQAPDQASRTSIELPEESPEASRASAETQDKSPEESTIEEIDRRNIVDTAVGKIDLGNMQELNSKDVAKREKLGFGAFGIVYRGTWKGRDVAIKKIKSNGFAVQQFGQDRLILEFSREAGVLSSLHNQNIVSLYGFIKDEQKGTIAIVMELVAGGSLRNFLHREDKYLNYRKRLILAKGAAIGMEYLHFKGVVHFDLKSDNLLVDLKDPDQPICKVTDFGLSKVKQNTLVSAGMRGTPSWMAPELFKGKSRVSEKVDVFSFGIVMWEILTGMVPYADMQASEILGGYYSDTLRPPVPESSNPAWRRLMEQCWASNPEQRPSFSQIVDRLHQMSLAS